MSEEKLNKLHKGERIEVKFTVINIRKYTFLESLLIKFNNNNYSNSFDNLRLINFLVVDTIATINKKIKLQQTLINKFIMKFNLNKKQQCDILELIKNELNTDINNLYNIKENINKKLKENFNYMIYENFNKRQIDRYSKFCISK